MKSDRTVGRFLAHAREVAGFRDAEAVPSSSSGKRRRLVLGGTRELRDADKTKEDRLSDEQKLDIWSAPCYLCGRGPSFGIDRLDSFGVYEAGNVEPCCTECNQSKSHHPLPHFLEHVAHIVEHNRSRELGNHDGERLERGRRPVRAMTDPPMVFPSATTAARILRCAKNALDDAVLGRTRAAGVDWEPANETDYRRQRIPASEARRTILAMRASMRKRG